MKLNDYKPLDALMYLFKGESGTGKSIALGSFPGPLYIASCDGRVAPLTHFPGIKDRTDLEFDIFTDYNKLAYKIESLSKDSEGFKTIAVDPLTGVARLGIGHLLKNRGSSQDNVIGGIPVMGISEYNGESSIIAALLLNLRIIRNQGVNTILTSHIVTSEQKTLDGRYITTRRLLTGGNKIAAEIPSYFDEVYHFFNTSGGLDTKKTFRAITSNAGEDFARTSFYSLKEEIDFTDKLFYPELVKAINEAKRNQEFFSQIKQGE